MKRKRRERVVSVLLVCILSFGLCTTTLATRVDVDADNTFWVRTKLQTGVIHMTRGDAYTWVTGELTRISLECTTALDASSDPNTAKVLGLYGTYLVYLHWVCNNISMEAKDTSWSIFQGPADFDTATAAELIDTAEILRDKIVQKNILPAVTNVSTNSYNATAALASPMPAGVDMLKGDEIFSNTIYYRTLSRLLQEYVDGSVLTILCNYFGEEGGSSRSSLLSAVNNHFPDEWVTLLEAGTPSPDMITVATDIKGLILPYMNVLNQCMVTFNTANARVLMDETFTSTDGDHSVTAYVLDLPGRSTLESTVSKVTMALYNYLYSSETGEAAEDPVVLKDVDLSKGALPIMANATLVNGEVKMEGDPNLTSIGYYVLAAGVVYDPFVSVAGNDSYLDTLRQFLHQSDQEADLIKVLQSAINTKKPLYMTEGGKDDWVTMDSVGGISIANYRIAYLSDMLQISQNATRAYAVIKGQMANSKVDSSTWEYVQGGLQAPSSQEASVAIGTTDPQEVVQPVNNSLVTVGTEELMASSSQMSKPVAFTSGSESLVMWGNANTFVAGLGGITSIIVHNASLDAKGNAYLEHPEKYMLFLNGLGDIVLQDGTIVLPAIANPTLYEYDVTAVAAGSAAETGYYPYTSAFSNHYPTARVSSDKEVYMSNVNDKGKYIVSRNDDGNEHAVRIYGVKSNMQMQTAITDRVKVVHFNGNSFSVSADTTEVYGLYKYLKGGTGNFRQIFGYGFSSPEYLTYTPQANSEGIAFFPLVEDNADVRDSYLGVSAPLVTSAVRYLSTSNTASSSTLESAGTFRIESYIYDYMGEGMLGTAYSETIVKNYQLSYDELVKDQYSRFTILIKDFVSGVLDTLGRIDGVLAIKNGYENGFFNALMSFVQRAYLIIAVGLLILIAVKFLRGHFNFLYVVMIACLVFAAFEVYAVWMPTAIPSAYNMVVNDVVENLVWNTITVKAEAYDETYKNSNRKDTVTGEPRPYTATVTLYRMTQGEMLQVCERTGANIVDVRSGVPIYLDEQAGIFVQGDSIKMSIDRLLVNNTMRGLYKSQWEQIEVNAEEVEPIDVQLNDNPYIIKLTNAYVSLESYYTPFCQIERSFLVNLNNFANIFRIDRNYYRYGNSVYKDAFLFNAFTNSGIFTAPGNDSVLRNNIRESSIDGSNLATADDIVDLCNRYFTPQEDWLNLRSIFANPSRAMRDSLWGQMLQRQGYYEHDWTMTLEQQEKMTQLVIYINDQTKQFVIRNQDLLNFCSDENAIKLVSLFATTAFTHRVSEFGYWLYPNYINAGDIELVDVLYGSMTSLADRNTASDGDIVNTVTLNLGVPGAILVLLITLFSVVFILLLTYLIPVLYALFGIILIYKLINEEQSIGLVKGYAKVTVVTTILYIVYSSGLRFVQALGYKWYGYFATMLVTAFCLYLLLYVIMSVVTNPLEFGNDNLMRNLFGALDKLTGGRLGRITTQSINIQSRNSYNTRGGYRDYLRTSSVDDRFNPHRVRRSEHYGRWEDFDDADMSARVRVINRFGRLADHADEVGSTRTGFRQSRVMRGVRSVGQRLGSTTWRNQEGTGLGDRFDNYRNSRSH